MKHKISKAKVKEAIITEPLQARRFFHNIDEHGDLAKDNGKCSVCAVGAVLRNTKAKTFAHDNAIIATGGTCDRTDISLAYEENNFLAILSCEFEAASDIDGGFDHWLDHTETISSNSNDMRMFLLFLVEAFCPTVLEFETES